MIGGNNMNNHQKLERTFTAVKEVRTNIEEPLKSQVAVAKSMEEKLRISQKILISMGLELQQENAILSLTSTAYGMYNVAKYNGRMRVRTVPICFLVTLYEQELKIAFPKEEIQIPFELRAFWKMERAAQLLEDFTAFQNKFQNTLLWEYRRLKRQQVAKTLEYAGILDEFVAFCTVNSKWKKQVSYNGMCVTMNVKNVKVDIVPLCKILTKYYANVIRKINRYLQASATKTEKEKLEEVKNEFKNFMDRHFISIK